MGRSAPHEFLSTPGLPMAQNSHLRNRVNPLEPLTVAAIRKKLQDENGAHSSGINRNGDEGF